MDELTNPSTEKKLTANYGVKSAEPEPVRTDLPVIQVGTAPAAPTKSEEPLVVAPVPTPPFFGARVVRGIDLKEIYEYINETALLKVRWGFKRARETSVAEYDAMMREKVYPEFEKWKAYALRENIFQPQVVYGYFKCAANGNDLLIYDESGQREVQRFTFPRQHKAPHRCITDFFRPVSSGERDVIGMSIVTIGSAATPRIQEIYKAAQYTDYLYLHGLSVETAEALAEYWHKRMREELGIAGDDAKDVKGLFQQQYHGGRYSFGYPACPNLEDQRQMFALLEPQRIGVELSEEFQLHPEQSTDALIVHHPEAKYFNAR